MIRRIEDIILQFLQRRCSHPSKMIAADVLEGCADGIAVAYCRRCGSIKTDWNPLATRFNTLEPAWRSPDPSLFRG